MNRLHRTFSQLRRGRRTALIPFVMAGDPTPSATVEIVCALAEAGADVIELGVPFSDPLADGPIIQRASARALAQGTTPQMVLNIVRRARRCVTTPIVLLSYYNPVVRYGDLGGTAEDPGPFVRAASAAGVDGLIIPDLPLEEGERFRRVARNVGLAPIFLATLTSSTARLRRIAQASDGFIYYVSVTGTTGVRAQLSSEWAPGVRRLKRLTKKPVCVGFGVSTPAQAAAVARVADGVIVGSALIRRLEGVSRAKAPKAAARFLRQLRRGVDS